MPTYLHRLIEDHSWANRGLLEFLGGHPDEVLDATAAGVYGSMRETLEHLLWSELRYHQHLVALPRVELPRRSDHADLAALRQLADESSGRWATLVNSLPEPGTMMQLDDGKRSAATIVTQLVMHGCEHRAHVGTILGAQGIEPPDLDAWAHGILIGGDDWPSGWGPEPANR